LQAQRWPRPVFSFCIGPFDRGGHCNQTYPLAVHREITPINRQMPKLK
jgi:hypothetical protein